MAVRAREDKVRAKQVLDAWYRTCSESKEKNIVGILTHEWERLEQGIRDLIVGVRAETVKGLEWSSENPTTPGLYWYIHDQNAIPVTVSVDQYQVERVTKVKDYWRKGSQWAGPLTPPSHKEAK